jgi:hypothetical protein
VHFSISGTGGNVTYEVEVADKKIVEGAGIGEVTGTFTMPDLGDAVRTVTVEADIRASGKRKKVKQELEYLGSALPVAAPPAPATGPALPAVEPQVAPLPEPIHAPAASVQASPAPAVTQPANDRPRVNRARPTIDPSRRAVRDGERRRRAHGGHQRRNRHPANKKTRARRHARRTKQVFDFAQPGAGSDQGVSSLNAIVPPAASLAANVTRAGDGGPNAAVVVPALFGLAALALAVTAFLRGRRLASRPGRD